MAADHKSKKDAGGDPLAAAFAALTSSLDRLDSAVDRHIEGSTAGRSVDEQVQRMAEDRSRLAQDLDESEARAQKLSGVNGEVSRRLVDVMETVRGVLDSDAASGPATKRGR
ncbi:DUF4164 domain-containing protein [Ahrensia sp. R2A130]|uniref:DUF4164 domain-containing protein n=1 Tax=Ahrensia sp. R2A130 TaxID=744979 RepID=UPI0002E30121|nr:DUF4164 domain-containing protein [Ahrensia sp. R2A130]